MSEEDARASKHLRPHLANLQGQHDANASSSCSLIMEKGIPPVPAFYACYLLRSIARHSSTYIGSTPNPPRRLKQHNGESKGGAVRTSRDTLRPWEMTALVTGFPSKIAALQFEWAWQNPTLTRHISPSSRITHTKQTSRISPRTGKVRRRAARPRLCLTDRLANLHLLLRATSFERWPLEVTFFAEDVHRMWIRWTTQQSETLRPGIAISLDESSCAPKKGPAEIVPPDASPIGIHALDLGYSSLKPQIEKCQELFNGKKINECSVCCAQTPTTGFGTLVCPNGRCKATSHLQCLSSTFLKAEGERAKDSLVPTSGSCPQCDAGLVWIDLVKDLSLRMRGEKEIKTMFKPKRTKKMVAAVGDGPESASEDDVLDAALPEEDDWNELMDSSGDDRDMGNARSDPVPCAPSFKRSNMAQSRLEPVIQDSESDEGDILC